MLPLEFLFITVRPVVVMQLRNRAAGGLDLRIVRFQFPLPAHATNSFLSLSARLQVYNVLLLFRL